MFIAKGQNNHPVKVEINYVHQLIAGRHDAQFLITQMEGTRRVERLHAISINELLTLKEEINTAIKLIVGL